MARINIDECWWSDPRRSILISLLNNDENCADGAILTAWHVSQKYWGDNKNLIPLSIFKSLKKYQEIIKAQLAIVTDEGVYVCGAAKYHEWYYQLIQKSSRAGKKSAEERFKRLGHNIPINATNCEVIVKPDNNNIILCENIDLKKDKDSNMITSVLNLPPNPLALAPALAPVNVINNTYTSSSRDDDGVCVENNNSLKNQNNWLGEDFKLIDCPLMKIWNEHCGKLKKIRTLGNGKRKKLALAKWKENPSKEYWIEVITKLNQSPFLTGNNKSEWQANFTWLVTQDNHLRVIEGEFDNNQKKQIEEKINEVNERWKKLLP